MAAMPVEDELTGHVSRKRAFVKHGKLLAVHISFIDTRESFHILVIQFGIFVKYNRRPVSHR